MKFKDMITDTPYRITKGNSDGSLLVGDIISIDSKDRCIDIWDGKNSGSFTVDDLNIPSVVDFDCEDASDDYTIYVSRWATECHKVCSHG